MQKTITKKLFGTIGIALIVSLLVLSFAPAQNVQAATYKETKYTSFSDVKKKLSKKDIFEIAGISYTTKKIRTKYGKKTRALFIFGNGFDESCTTTYIYIKHNGKILRVAKLAGVPQAISKNRKYMYVNLGPGGKRIYKYKKGKYKMIKDSADYDNGTDSDGLKILKKWRKEFNMPKDNIIYK